jgi:hypothetical protein
VGVGDTLTLDIPESLASVIEKYWVEMKEAKRSRDAIIAAQEPDGTTTYSASRRTCRQRHATLAASFR